MQTSSKSLEDYKASRMKFSSSWTFMLTSLGFAAGFGSVWRFPYRTIIYFISLSCI